MFCPATVIGSWNRVNTKTTPRIFAKLQLHAIFCEIEGNKICLISSSVHYLIYIVKYLKLILKGFFTIYKLNSNRTYLHDKFCWKSPFEWQHLSHNKKVTALRMWKCSLSSVTFLTGVRQFLTHSVFILNFVLYIEKIDLILFPSTSL